MKAINKALTFIFASFLLVGCGGQGQDVEPPHEHSFSEDWSYNESNHWHTASCEHTELTKDLGNHTFGSDHKCTVCGYIMPLNKYMVSFNTNEGTYIPSYLALEGTTIEEPNDPSRENRAFYGWYDNAEFEGEQYDFDTKLTGDITLYARWGYSFECIDHDGSIFHKEVLLDGEIIKPLIQDPVKQNETFIGWYEDETFEGEQFVFSNEIHKNTTVYASFGFSINFYSHDGTKYANIVVPEGKKLEAPESPSKEFYDFDTWYTDELLTDEYDFNDEVISEFDLYAGFTASHYEIIYHNCENATINNPDEYQYTIGLDSLEDPTKEGYRFYGWYTNEQLTDQITFIDAALHEDIDIYAYFSKEYSVTYKNWPVGVENPNPTSFTVEEKEDLIMNPFDDYPGFTFVSYTDDDGKVYGKTDASHDLELTANYTCTKTLVTFDANGGEVIGLDNYIYLDALTPDSGDPIRYEVPAATDTKSKGFNPNEHVPYYEGHVFKGWYLDRDFNQPITKNELTLVESGQTLYAKWEELPENYVDIKNGFEWSDGWQPKPYSKTIIGRAAVPYNVKDLSIYYFASISGGNIVASSNGIYADEDVAHTIYMSKPNVDFIFDDVRVDVTSDKAISYGFALECSGGDFDECLPSCSVTFNVLSYREEYIKVGPINSVTMSVDYWSTLELPYIENEGYTFVGWYYGDTLIDLSKPFPIYSSSVTLKAHWKKNS